ncbi:MAG: class I SAM-dependent methyltransferase [Betaproteobacteria bacterium]|nr:class I SAM-dependent methyltransferase [Betaproteobacteria bacterium]
MKAIKRYQRYLSLWALGLAASMGAAASAHAQSGVGDVVYVPTPQVVVDEMLNMVKLNKSDFLIDLGSGDGRLVITAAKKHGARALGVDLDRYLLKVANEAAQKEGVTERVTFREQNLFQTDLSDATVISTYLLPSMNLKLRPSILALKPGTRVVAHDYAMGDWYPDEQKTLVVPEKKVGNPGISYIFSWVVPALAAGQWQSTINVSGKDVAYQFDLTQFFQNIDGNATAAGGAGGEVRGKMTGEQIRFSVSSRGAQKIERHEFQGVMKGDTITGTVRIGLDSTQRPWTAKLIKRGAMTRAQDEGGN